MAITPLYTALTTLSVNSDTQTVFPLVSIPTVVIDSIVIHNHLFFRPNTDYTITTSPDQLNWLGVDTEAGEKLFLLSDIDTGALFDAAETVYVTTDGQTQLPMALQPEGSSVLLIIFGLTFFLAEDGDFTVSGSVITWSGITLSVGDKLRVVYKKES